MRPQQDIKNLKPIRESEGLVLKALLANDENITSVDNTYRFNCACTRTTVSNIRKRLFYEAIYNKEHKSSRGAKFSTYHLNPLFIDKAKSFVNSNRTVTVSTVSKA